MRAKRWVNGYKPALCLGIIGVIGGLGGCGGGWVREAKRVKPVFAENFESGEIDAKVWGKEIRGANTIEVQKENAAHGKYALRVSCPASSNKTWAFLTLKNIPASLRTHHFGRAYVMITPQAPTRHVILLTAGTTGFPFDTYEEVATANGKWQLTYVDLKPGGNKEDYHAGAPMPWGKWVLLEWEFNDHPDHATIWVDGVPALDTGFTAKETRKSDNLVGGFTDYAFGFRLWGAAPDAFDVYYDDIALDDKRIGPVK
jgi:hypothetical protein